MSDSVNRWLIDNTLNPLEDFLRWLFPRWWQLLRPIWHCRKLLSEGRARRRLRKAVVAWRERGTVQSTDYFRDHDVKDSMNGKMIVVTIEYRDSHP